MSKRSPLNTSALGNDFERRVFELLDSDIRSDRFPVKSSHCRLRHRPRYYSRDRQSDIVFDISIEVFLPGSDRPSLLWLIECKNYQHAVPVDDIEEFFTKVQQVAAAGAKAVVVARSSFQSGAFEFAAAKRIGLIRAMPNANLKWILHRSVSTCDVPVHTQIDLVHQALTVEDFQSRRFEVFCKVKDHAATSVADFFEVLLRSSELPPVAIAAITNDSRAGERVECLSREEIEARCQEIHAGIGYGFGPVPLELVCSQYGVIVDREVPASEERAYGTLGRVDLMRQHITLFDSGSVDAPRERFTLAHELGHVLLGHSRYLHTETVDDADLERLGGDDVDDDDLRRMEWQANSFASRLLLPRNRFISDVVKLANALGIRDRGHGLIYVDEQRINQQTYYAITDALVAGFAASRSAIRIRLIELGLLVDTRGMQSTGFERIGRLSAPPH